MVLGKSSRTQIDNFDSCFAKSVPQLQNENRRERKPLFISGRRVASREYENSALTFDAC